MTINGAIISGDSGRVENEGNKNRENRETWIDLGPFRTSGVKSPQVSLETLTQQTSHMSPVNRRFGAEYKERLSRVSPEFGELPNR